MYISKDECYDSEKNEYVMYDHKTLNSMYPNYNVDDSYAEFDTEAYDSDIEEPENKAYEYAKRFNEILSV